MSKILTTQTFATKNQVQSYVAASNFNAAAIVDTKLYNYTGNLTIYTPTNLGSPPFFTWGINPVRVGNKIYYIDTSKLSVLSILNVDTNVVSLSSVSPAGVGGKLSSPYLVSGTQILVIDNVTGYLYNYDTGSGTWSGTGVSGIPHNTGGAAPFSRLEYYNPISGKYFVVSNGALYTSTDGTSWSSNISYAEGEDTGKLLVYEPGQYFFYSNTQSGGGSRQIYLSMDDGLNWADQGIQYATIMYKTPDNTVYKNFVTNGWQDALYKMIPGVGWQAVPFPGKGWIQAIHYNPVRETLMISTNAVPYSLYVTQDGGLNWTQSEGIGTYYGIGIFGAVSDSLGNDYYFASQSHYDNFLMKDAPTWKPSNYSDSVITNLVFNPVNKKMIYGDDQGNILENNIESPTKVILTLPESMGTACQIPGNKWIAIVGWPGVNGGTYQSSDGYTWTKIAPPPSTSLLNYHLKYLGNNIIAGIDDYNGVLYISYDLGYNWSQIYSSGIFGAIFFNVSRLASDGSIVIPNPDPGINYWFLRYNGSTWDPWVPKSVYFPMQPNLVWEEDGGIYATPEYWMRAPGTTAYITSNVYLAFSSNNGASWSFITQTNKPTGDRMGISRPHFFTNIRYVSARTPGSPPTYKIYKTSAKFDSFTLMYTSSPTYYLPTGIAVDDRSSNESVLYLATDENELMSNDGGASFYPIYSTKFNDQPVVTPKGLFPTLMGGAPGAVTRQYFLTTPPLLLTLQHLTNATNITAFYRKDTTFYAGTAPNGDIFKSSNNGVTWTLSGSLSSPVSCITASPNGDLFASSLSGHIFKSINNGTSWTDLGQITGGITNITSIVATNSNIYAGTSDSGKVYYSDNNGVSWSNTQLGSATKVNTLYDLGFSGIIFAGTSPSGKIYLSDSTLNNIWREDTSINLGVTSINCLSQGLVPQAFFAGTGATGKSFEIQYSVLSGWYKALMERRR